MIDFEFIFIFIYRFIMRAIFECFVTVTTIVMGIGLFAWAVMHGANYESYAANHMLVQFFGSEYAQQVMLYLNIG